ncbi:MAG: gfo/Idh/MocA family oxidoreductase [Candidatus Riflebacteria bacterium]|nr:gfo/Idh/MocA family oxidoreductase [Candidatus Riflebacteria bacterium]
MKYWLIGAGLMSQEYAKVLVAQKIDFLTIGRSEKSALEFEKKTGKSVITGGLEKFLKTNPSTPAGAIVSVGVDELKSATVQLLNQGIKKILVEKPGGVDCTEIKELDDASKKCNAKVLLAYNRRFFSSVIKAKEMLQEDGGVLSFQFDFTEWGHEIEKLDKPKKVLENWFLANSTHVSDMAFFMGGRPKELNCYVSGSLKWHQRSSVFSGSGVSDKGALFSYSANWGAPGRWGVEVLSKSYRYFFRPLEKLSIQKKGSVAIEEIQLNDSIDKEFKPGLFLQTKAFIENDFLKFCDMNEQYQNSIFYKKIAGY